MTKYVFGTFLTCFIVVFCGKAQNTYSPYSSLGLGEIVSSDYSRTAGMAGVGIGIRNGTFLNTSNPAGVAAIDSVTGVFDVGVFAKDIYIKSSNYYNDNAFTGNLNKIAFGFRAKKWWGVSIGVRPYSNVGYYVADDEAVEGSTSTKTVYMEGDGGLYNLYMTNAVELIDNKLSFGVTTSLIAGRFTNTEDQTTYTYVTTSRVTQIYNKVGLQYQFANKIGDWVLGATYGYKQYTPIRKTFQILSGTTVESTEKLRTTHDFLPENYGIGASLNRQKFLFAVEAEAQNWSGLTSNSSSIGIGNSYSFKAGVGYTPYKDLYTAHLAKQYQFGFSVNKTSIEVEHQAAWNYAVSTGITFPLRAGQTQRGILNMGLEFGSNLTAPSGYLKENYLMLNVNFSFIEAMFMKSKIF